MRSGKTFKKKAPPFVDIPDHAVVTQNELAQALRVSRWTIVHYKDLGYEFQFGTRTTPGHAKKWMEDHKDLLKAKPRTPKEEEEVVQLKEKLANLK